MIPLIESIMYFDEYHNASVDFNILHSDLATTEYARLSLLYYAKILYNIDPLQKEAPWAYMFLLDSTRRISEAEISREMDILKVANIDDVINLSPLIGKKQKYAAKMFFISTTTRSIKTKIPFRGILQQMTFSVPLLIGGAIKCCDISDIELLQLGLKIMNTEYNKSGNYNKLSSLVRVPNAAFLAAFISDERRILHTHVLYNCRGCSKNLRLPRGKGKILARCPNCRYEFMANTF